MKNLILICGLILLIGAYSLNDESKLPPDYHYPKNKFHVYIWKSDSVNSKEEPLDAQITLNNDSITDIESWDGLKKTQKGIFKPVKVRWDAENDGTGLFDMFGIRYTVQIADEFGDGSTYQCPGNFRKPDSAKNKK